MDYQDVFFHSWDAMERRCAAAARDLPVELGLGVRELIREMRSRGYDRRFRAGMAHYSLILSRSTEHGLRNEQPYVMVQVLPWMQERGMEVWCGPGKGTRFVEDSYRLTARLEAALADLARAPID